MTHPELLSATMASESPGIELGRALLTKSEWQLTLLCGFLAWVAGDYPVTNLLVYRFALLGFSIANLILIVMILPKLNRRHVLAGAIWWRGIRLEGARQNA